MAVIYLCLLIAAALCLLFAAVPLAQSRPALLPLGLLFFVLVFMIKAAVGFH